MKQVTEKEWREKAAGLAEWRKNRTSPPNLDLYKKIVSMVHIGKSVLDCGAGQQHLKKCLPDHVTYTAHDPFPLSDDVVSMGAEELINVRFDSWETIFILSALDNVRDVERSLRALRWAAKTNIVILTGIGIPPDQFHTVQVDREDLVSVLGEPTQEIEISPKLFLFEWIL